MLDYSPSSLRRGLLNGDINAPIFVLFLMETYEPKVNYIWVIELLLVANEMCESRSIRGH